MRTAPWTVGPRALEDIPAKSTERCRGAAPSPLATLNPVAEHTAMVDYSRFAHIDDSSSDDDDVAMEHVKHVAREVLGRPGGPQQNIDEMLESFRQGEARRRPDILAKMRLQQRHVLQRQTHLAPM